jgi:CopG family transcriptional regulator / antitoxin EndoAI
MDPRKLPGFDIHTHGVYARDGIMRKISNANQRINIVLPRETLAILDRVASKGKRSSFISKAVLHYVEVGGKQNLRERLKREAMLNAERDLGIAAEWFPIEEEAEVVASALPLRRKSKNAERA